MTKTSRSGVETVVLDGIREPLAEPLELTAVRLEQEWNSIVQDGGDVFLLTP